MGVILKLKRRVPTLALITTHQYFYYGSRGDLPVINDVSPGM